MIKQDKGGRGRMIKAEELLDKIRSQNEVYNALKYQILTLKAEPGVGSPCQIGFRTYADR